MDKRNKNKSIRGIDNTLAIDRDFSKFDIVLVNFSHYANAVIKKVRPCVIVSSDTRCRFDNYLSVCPLTTKRKKSLPTHYTLNGDISSGTLLCEEIIAVPKSLVIRRLGNIRSKVERNCIDHCLKVSLGLGEV